MNEEGNLLTHQHQQHDPQACTCRYMGPRAFRSIELHDIPQRSKPEQPPEQLVRRKAGTEKRMQ